MGRVMYGVMAYWDDVDLDDPATPTSSANSRGSGGRRQSTSCRAAARPAARTPRSLEGDVVEAVRRLKEQDGPDLGLGGGADLFATLSEAGLIDTTGSLSRPARSARARPSSGP